MEVIPHYLSEKELIDEFGKNGWKQLPDMISNYYRGIIRDVI